jgi:hypothetical protein
MIGLEWGMLCCCLLPMVLFYQYRNANPSVQMLSFYSGVFTRVERPR